MTDNTNTISRQQQVVTINNTDYQIDSLSDEAKSLIQHLQVIESELFRIVNVHQSLTAGKQAATAQLIQLVETKEDEGNT